MTRRTSMRLMGVGGVLGLFRLRFGSRRVVLLDLFAVAGIAIGVGLLFASQERARACRGVARDCGPGRSTPPSTAPCNRRRPAAP